MSRHADVDRIRLQLSHHQRLRPYDTSSANARAVQQNDVGADPDIVLYDNSAAAGLETLVNDFLVAASKFVVHRGEGAICSDENVFADVDAVSCIDHASGIDVAVAANAYVPRSAGRLDLDEGIDVHAVFDDDACATNRLFDVGEFRDDGGRCDDDQASAPTGARFRSATDRIGSVTGHRMPKAGSFHNTPRASSG